MTRAALIGCGDVSVVHLEAIAELPGVELAGVCDTDPGRARAASERYGVPAFTDHHELLTAVRPEVVHVTTPHHQHVDVAIDCLDAGAGILVEKPVAHTVEEADRLVAATRSRPELRAGICLQNRYNTTSRAAHDLLASGELGTVLGASATVLWHREAAYYAARPWRGQVRNSGGGVLINQAIHTLDLLQWLLGDVVGVRGHSGRYLLKDIDVEDTAHAVLEHAGGARSTFFATVTHVTDSPVTIEIVTERAVLLIRGDLTVTYADGRVETVAERPPGSGGRAYWGASHELLIADFYRTLAGPAPFWISPQEGAGSLRLVHRIYHQPR
ncbi:Gfo/Idh/MocA family protein [Actinoplanes friuliensis]|uniref:Dehydrogenase n=1 Tax=Actinoplanes friuliensis DSM 7358 TaxID=1246995 RepID=U5W176_9ACTN|nr:Gfo/Idh/MocA family oxidoreductase [Actinoplanes friuliensis]AGZ41646.1 dehydrogenase [Actinoplanes friuliensis DSM 7358]